MTDSNFIKYFKTEVDELGSYREYAVYKKDGIFIFENLDWQILDGNSSRSIRKMYEERENEQGAIQAYEACIAVWE